MYNAANTIKHHHHASSQIEEKKRTNNAIHVGGRLSTITLLRGHCPEGAFNTLALQNDALGVEWLHTVEMHLSTDEIAAEVRLAIKSEPDLIRRVNSIGNDVT